MQRRSSTWKVGVTLLVVIVYEREEGSKSGGGGSYIRAGVVVACEPRSCVCVGPGYRHSNPRVQSRLDRELFRRGCVARCAPSSRGFDGREAEATIAIRKTSGTTIAEISAARIRSCHHGSVMLKTRFIRFLAKFQKSQTPQSSQLDFDIYFLYSKKDIRISL